MVGATRQLDLEPIIRVDRISAAHDGQVVLRDVDLDVRHSVANRSAAPVDSVDGWKLAYQQILTDRTGDLAATATSLKPTGK